jgi:enamine deaminase RidA (YjgF/YER057c/UK114 family)
MAPTRQQVPDGSPFATEMGFSKAVRAGSHVFVSGQMSLDPSGEVLHPGDLAAQFREAFAQVVRAVEEAGGTAADVVATHMFLTEFPDEQGFVDVCDAHRAAFDTSEHRPTGTMVYVPRLPVAGALVEVTATAVIGG